MLSTKVLLRLKLLCKILFGCVSDMSMVTWANEQICVFVCLWERDCVCGWVCMAVYSVNFFFSFWGKIWVRPVQLKLKIVQTTHQLISSFNEVTARNFPSRCGSLWRKKNTTATLVSKISSRLDLMTPSLSDLTDVWMTLIVRRGIFKRGERRNWKKKKKSARVLSYLTGRN